MLAHSVVGDGPSPVIMLHGFLGMGRNLSSLARRWSQADASLRIILPDLTGHGTSPPLPPDADLATLANDAVELLRSLGVTQAHWVGHSLGGRVALAAAQRAPLSVSRMTLLDIAPGPLPPGDGVAETLGRAPDHAAERSSMKRFLVEEGVPDGLAEWLMMNLARGEDGYRWRIDRAALLALRARSGTEDLWEVVESGHIPLHVIRGGASPFVSNEDLARYASAGAQVDTIAGAAHFIHMDAPDALLALLTAA